MKICLVLVLSLILKCSAFPDGAPASEELCGTLLPSHGVSAQTSASPFKIIVSSTSIDGGEIIDVEIRADAGRSFKGFYLIARTLQGAGRDLGEFLLSEDEPNEFKLRQCGNGFNNAVTHVNRDLKERISFKWLSPKTFEGKVVFV